jgi:hypothetical protein
MPKSVPAVEEGQTGVKHGWPEKKSHRRTVVHRSIKV